MDISEDGVVSLLLAIEHRLPIVIQYENNEIKCPWCNEIHWHGWGSGTRRSHCDTDENRKDYALLTIRDFKILMSRGLTKGQIEKVVKDRFKSAQSERDWK